MSLKSNVNKLIQKISDKVSNSGVMQEENDVSGEHIVFAGMPELIREASYEGMVLLKNNGVLPLKSEQTISVFGRCQIDYFYVGYGSGGDVNAPYLVNVLEGLENAGATVNQELAEKYKHFSETNEIDHGYWGHWPMNYPEMPVDMTLAREASQKSDVALVIIGRAAGEDRENELIEGSYYLTAQEKEMLDSVCSAFNKVIVVMDCGNIVDMAWTEDYGDKISAIIYAWQCGMESGNALADVIMGKANPSGKLSDTIARNYEDYPSSATFGGKDYNEYQEDIFVGYRYFETFDKDKVLYPFGFGLSYTSFEITPMGISLDGDVITAKAKVKNVGEVAGKEAVQLYFSAPQGKLSKASRALVAFKKSKELAPNEEQELEMSFTLYDISCFDDTGETGNKSCYVLEEGDYVFYVGNSVRDTQELGKISLEYTVIERLTNACSPQTSFEHIVARYHGDTLIPVKKTVHPEKPYLRDRILENMPEDIEPREYNGEKLVDVADGILSLDDFVAILSDEELEVLSRGQGYMNSEHGVEGNAGAFGGTCQSLIDKGVLPIITTDGPAGIRIKRFTSLLPCGTALACTFNTELVEELATVFGKEMVFRETDVILAPGMNIHRNVLCGRNFEYFSEDPILCGKISSAYVKGVQSENVSACPKHFACNNQEVRRTKTDSRVSERALREIYLKGYEICVKEAKPLNIMTSYNKINGVWSHYNYDLVTTILRGEWGYEGNIMTDWWMQSSPSPEFPIIKDNAYRVRAQVDVLMPGGTHTAKKYKSDGTLLPTLGKPDGIRRGELQRTAKNVINLILKLKY